MNRSKPESMNKFLLIAGVLAGLLILPQTLCAEQATGAKDKAAVPPHEGVVVDETGKPLDRAFVWLETDPRVCDFTKKDGKFRLEAGDKPADADVLASAAGKDGSRMRLGDLRKAAGRIVLKQEDPEFTKIEVGAALAFTKNAAASTFIKPRPLSDAELTCGLAYLDFLRREGNAMVEAMLVKGGPDPAIGGKYHYIIVGEIAARAQWYEQARKACKVPASRPEKERPFWNGLWQGNAEETIRCQSFTKPLEESGRKSLAKGYAGLHLTDHDLRLLRYWQIQQPSMRQFLQPNNLVGELASLEVAALQYLRAGDSFPAIQFLDLETMLGRSVGISPPTLSLTEPLRPEGLADVLRLKFPYYAQTAGPDGRKQCVPCPSGKQEKAGDVGDIRARSSGRPFVVANWGPGDRFAWRSMDLLEYLHRAYGERVAFYLVVTPSKDGYMADAYVNEFQFLGGNPDEAPLRGLACRQGELISSPEQLARNAVQARMENVTDSIPILLDGRDGWLFNCFAALPKGIQGNAQGFDPGVIGGSGWLAAGLFDRQARLELGTGAIIMELNGRVRAESDYYIGCNHEPVRNLEVGIRALFSPEGAVPDWKTWGTGLDAQRNCLTVAAFEITDIDPAGSIVRAKYKGKEYQFKLAVDGRVALEKWAGSDNLRHVAGTLLDLKPGMTVYPDIVLDRPLPPLRPKSQRVNNEPTPPFPVDEYAGREVETLRLNTYSMHDSKVAVNGVFNAFFGRVTAREKKCITVACNKAEMKKAGGWRLWQALGNKASVDTNPSNDIRTRDRLAIMQKMLAEPGDTVKRVFAIDRAVRINRNGVLQDMNKLGEAVEVGDFVMVQYEYFYELQDEKTLWPEWIWAAAPQPPDPDAGAHLSELPGLRPYPYPAATGPEYGIAEWRKRIGQQTAADNGDAEFMQLSRGAAYYAFIRLEKTEGAYAQMKIAGKHPGVERAFSAWFREQGAGLIEQYPGDPPPDNAKKRRLVLARLVRDITGEDGKTTGVALVKMETLKPLLDAAYGAFTKGCLEQRLSESDIYHLRVARAIKEIFNTTPNNICPYWFGLAPSYQLRRGELFPAFVLADAAAVWRRPDYQDMSPADQLGFLSTDSIMPYLNMMDGLEKGVTSGGRAYVKRSDAAARGTNESGQVRLSALLTDKPLVVFCFDTKDIFGKRCMPLAEALRQAYRGRVEFVLIQTTQADQYQMLQPHFGLMHSWWSNEKDGARIVRRTCLDNPQFGVRVLLDSLSFAMRDARLAKGGNGDAMILDKRGRLHYANSGANTDDAVWWANELEEELVALLQNGGGTTRDGQIMPVAPRLEPGLGVTLPPAPRLNKALQAFLEKNGTTNPRFMQPGAEKDAKLRSINPAAMVNRGITGYAHFDASRPWLCGEIASISNCIVTVSLSCCAEEMTGYQLAKTVYRDKPAAAWNAKSVAVLDRWVADARDGKAYQFGLSRDDEIYLNGAATNGAALQTSDRVAILYDAEKHLDPAASPVPVAILRASRPPGHGTPAQ